MRSDRPVAFWIAVGAVGFALVPWYAVDDGMLHFGWMASFASREHAPALWQALAHGRWWLLPLGALLALAALSGLRLPARHRANALIAIGATGFAYFFAQGFAIGPKGWTFAAHALPAHARARRLVSRSRWSPRARAFATSACCARSRSCRSSRRRSSSGWG